MIFANIRGRLGNQLFIYAMARGLQNKTGQDVTLNYSSYKKHYNSDKMDLSQFNIPNNIHLDNTNRLPWYANTDSLIIKALRHYFPRSLFNFLAKRNIFMWLGELYEPLIIDEKKDIYLDGFWQSAKYFDEIHDELVVELEPQIILQKACEELLERIIHTNSVCVSVRRGDYVTNEANRAIYYVCDEVYLEKSIQKMDELLQEKTWIVFSDDIEWVKQNVSFPGEVYYQPNCITPMETLKLMKNCKHFIISNSSYSWWGQYLSTSKNKIVISPNKWYVDGRPESIICDNWIKISV